MKVFPGLFFMLLEKVTSMLKEYLKILLWGHKFIQRLLSSWSESWSKYQYL